MNAHQALFPGESTLPENPEVESRRVPDYPEGEDPMCSSNTSVREYKTIYMEVLNGVREYKTTYGSLPSIQGTKPNSSSTQHYFVLGIDLSIEACWTKHHIDARSFLCWALRATLTYLTLTMKRRSNQTSPASQICISTISVVCGEKSQVKQLFQ